MTEPWLQTGTVVRFGIRRGFGFIAPDDESPRVFFHVKECFLRNEFVKVGDKVAFEINQCSRHHNSRRACQVRVIS